MSQDKVPKVWCVVVAGGSGRRFGSAKQFEDLDGERVIDRSVRVARASCDGVVAVVPETALGTPDGSVPGADAVVPGGSSRAASVRCGLEAVPADAEVILVHDAARPLATEDVYRRVIDAVRAGAVAAVPAVAVTDTIRDLDRGALERDRLRAVQTPQAFRAQELRAVHTGDVEATDDATLLEREGHRVDLVDGDPTNLKLTGPADMVVAVALLRARDESPDAHAGRADHAPEDVVHRSDGGDSVR